MIKACRVLSFCALLVFSAVNAFAASKTVTANSSAVIGSVLELTVSGQGRSELRFGNIQPSGTAPVEAGPVVMIVHVESNSGERYQVTHATSGPLQNPDGYRIELENLKFKTSALASNGTVVSSLTPVSLAPQVVFTSDLEGSSDTVQAEYTLTIPANQPPGDYSTFLTYTASTL